MDLRQKFSFIHVLSLGVHIGLNGKIIILSLVNECYIISFDHSSYNILFSGILINHLKSYDIDFPTVTDSAKYHLGFLTDSSSKRRRKRDINLVDDREYFHYNFNANGEEFHMKLRVNKHLFGPNFKVEHYYGNGSTDSVKMTEHCYLIGETVPTKYQVAISDCDGLVSTKYQITYIVQFNKQLLNSVLVGNANYYNMVCATFI
jgi:hypothetical protein